jgi:polyhydroxyalkanoate synthesis regulator phasin
MGLAPRKESETRYAHFFRSFIEEKHMLDSLKQAVYTSLGLASMTSDKISEAIRELTKKADLTEKEIQEFTAEVARRSGEAKKQIEQQIDHQIDHAFIQLGLLKSGIRQTADAASSSLQQMIDERIDAALERLGIARLEDIQSLTQRVEQLEKKA